MKAILASLALATALGCMNPKMAWVYTPQPRQQATPLVDSTLVVLPLEDQRQTTNKDRTLVGLIPLVPFGWADFGAPESAGQFRFEPKDDLARALAEEIENARIFREAVFDARARDGDYVLKGRIEATRLRTRIYFYGLSLPGDLLWLLGFPGGTSWNELTVDLQLFDAAGRNLWTHRVDERARDVAWIYEGNMQPFFFETLWKQAIRKALPSLAAAARGLSHPHEAAP